jgi:hypothetical protein
MGAVFSNTPTQPTVVAIQVGKIYLDAPCKFCRDGKGATTNIRPVDYIGLPIADMNVRTPHAEQLIPRARPKNLKIPSLKETLEYPIAHA